MGKPRNVREHTHTYIYISTEKNEYRFINIRLTYYYKVPHLDNCDKVKITCKYCSTRQIFFKYSYFLSAS